MSNDTPCRVDIETNNYYRWLDEEPEDDYENDANDEEGC